MIAATAAVTYNPSKHVRPHIVPLFTDRGPHGQTPTGLQKTNIQEGGAGDLPILDAVA
jgi:hypothetical protein